MRNAIILLALFCAACSNYSANLPSIKPYRMEIQQGNVVTSKMMLQLRPGMTKSQVRFIMGTPLIVDPFHANRWDYVYRMEKDGKLIEQRHVIMDFENDQLKRIRGDVVPAGTEGAAPASGEKPVSKTEPVTIKPAPAPGTAPKEKEKGLLDKLKFWKSDEPAGAPQPEAKPAPKAEPTPTPAPVPAEEQKPEPKPEPEAAPEPEAKPEPAPVPRVEPESTPAPVPAEEQKPEPKPEPKAVPEPEVKPEPAPVPKVEQKPEPTPALAPKVELKPLPKPADDLPPEDDPGYFEKMLEKIGF